MKNVAQKRENCEPWGWAIVDKNGDLLQSVRPRLVNFFGAVNHRTEPLTQEDVSKANSEYPGTAPCLLVTLYAAPPKREPLSDDEMWQLWNSCGVDDMDQSEAFSFARAIELAHGIGG